ncbi:hypothetical protein [Actinomadura bangladeshensis]|uniref:Uncharacterized protein n=1 Tax=Actinomadura bangladeshensis TaxID=453573 RepID=A0A4R4NER7_9ACTN|nr:hypothetical protein [Actinomadura bangladeshensis]TDC06884.1 hypothetical protein E1284_33230 [Actinomadura bangladeshensis]
MPHAGRRLDRATQALAAYEKAAFPGTPSLLRRDAFYSQALLAALICDLEHYAHHHGHDFATALSTGRALNAAEAAEDAPYKVGDQVRLTREHDRCGTVIGWQTTSPHAETDFLVAVPGIPFVYAEPATHLAPAPAFPPTTTVLGTVHHADQAERLYTTITTRLPDAPEPTRHALEHDRRRLLTALSSWSGITETRLHDALAPRPPANRHQPSDTRAAAADFPADISQSLPAAEPHDHSRDQPPHSPGRPGVTPAT